MRARAARARGQRLRLSLDLTCHSATVPFEDPVQITRIDGRLLSERAHLRADRRLRGLGAGRTTSGTSCSPTVDAFFRNHSWGYQAGRGGPRLYGAPALARAAGSPGVRQWVLFRMPDHGGYYHLHDLRTAARSMGRGGIMLPDRIVPITDVQPRAALLRGRPPAGARAAFTLTDAEGVERSYELARPGLGLLPGRWVLRRVQRRPGPRRLPRRLPRGGRGVGRVAIRPTWSARTAQTFEFEHAWAENFVTAALAASHRPRPLRVRGLRGPTDGRHRSHRPGHAVAQPVRAHRRRPRAGTASTSCSSPTRRSTTGPSGRRTSSQGSRPSRSTSGTPTTRRPTTS